MYRVKIKFRHQLYMVFISFILFSLYCIPQVYHQILESSEAVPASDINKKELNVQRKLKYSHQRLVLGNSSAVSLGYNASLIRNSKFMLRNETPVILYWTKWFDGEWGQWGATPEDVQCPVRNCFVTTDRNFVDQSNAIIFHSLDISIFDLPTKRKADQLWIWAFWESPSSRGHFDKNHEGLFNWTLTYRRDSDIYASYGRVLPKSWRTKPLLMFGGDNFVKYFPLPEAEYKDDPLPQIAIKSKTYLVAWFVSNCKTNGHRELYVQELQKFIPVDIFGKCGTFDCPRKAESACNRILESKYKFYLSFENSFCRDYVTEKFFKILQYNIVPVVYGGAVYSEIAPPMSYIDASNFTSPEHLARYLQYLDENDKEYLQYFRWKKYYTAVLSPEPWICELCERLQHPVVPKPARTDLQAWWVGEAECNTGISRINPLDINLFLTSILLLIFHGDNVIYSLLVSEFLPF